MMLSLHLADYTVLALSLLPVLGLDFMCCCRRNTVAEYLHGDHTISTLPLAFSLAGCFLSVINVQGLAAEVYYYGVSSGFVLASVWGPLLSVCLFVCLLYPLKLTSIYQYLDGRFHHSAPKVVAFTLGIVSMLTGTCMCAYSLAVTMETVTWLPTWLTMLVITSLCTATTALGGFRAVVWSNTLQMCVLFFSLIALCSLGTLRILEHWSEDSWDMVMNHDKLAINMNPSPLERGSVYQLGAALGLSQMSVLVLQPAVMRFSAAHSLAQASLAGVLGVLLSLLMTTMLVFLGVLMLIHDADPACTQPLATNVTSSYQLLYVYAHEVSSFPGVTGVYIAAALAATLSTVSSAQSAMTTLLWTDILAHVSSSMTDRTLTCLLRLLTVGVGMLILSTSLTVKYAGPLFYQVMCLVLTSSGGPIFGMFFTAACFPCVGAWAATISCLLSCVVCVWLSSGAAFYHVTWLAPASLYACAPNATVQLNHTLAMYSGFGIESGPFLVSNGVSNVSAADTNCPIDIVYSLSPYMYHVIGFSLVLVLSLLTSLIPALRQRDTRSKYVFCFVRCLAGSYSTIEDEDGDNGRSKTKREATSIIKEEEPASVREEAPTQTEIIPETVAQTTRVQPERRETHRPRSAHMVVQPPERTQIIRQPSQNAHSVAHPQQNTQSVTQPPRKTKSVTQPKRSTQNISQPPRNSQISTQPPRSHNSVTFDVNSPRSDDELSQYDEVFTDFADVNTDVTHDTPGDDRRGSRPGSMEVNNNMVAYRRKHNPDDPALILANILQGAQRSGERDRLLSSNTRL